MKIRVRRDACQGHAMCALTCPEVFHTDDETGHAYISDEQVPFDLEENVRAAWASCPEGAIDIY